MLAFVLSDFKAREVQRNFTYSKWRSHEKHLALETLFTHRGTSHVYTGMGQNLVPLVNPKIAGKWM